MPTARVVSRQTDNQHAACMPTAVLPRRADGPRPVYMRDSPHSLYPPLRLSQSCFSAKHTIAQQRAHAAMRADSRAGVAARDDADTARLRDRHRDLEVALRPAPVWRAGAVDATLAPALLCPLVSERQRVEGDARFQGKSFRALAGRNRGAFQPRHDARDRVVERKHGIAGDVEEREIQRLPWQVREPSQRATGPQQPSVRNRSSSSASRWRLNSPVV